MSEKPDYMTDEEYEEWKKSNEASANLPKTRIHVSVDSKQMEKLLKENVKLERGSKEFGKFHDSVMKHARRVLSNDEIEALDDTTFEGLGDIVSAFKKREKWLAEEENPKPISSGITELNSAQLGRSNEMGFDSIVELVDFLQAKRKVGTVRERKEASAILDELMGKWIKGKKESPITMNYTHKELDEVTGKPLGVIEKMKRKFQKEQLMRRARKIKEKKEEGN